MYGMRYIGLTVATVLTLLRARHITVTQYREEINHFSKSLRPDQVPAGWHVYAAYRLAPGQVQLFVGPTPTSDQI